MDLDAKGVSRHWNLNFGGSITRPGLLFICGDNDQTFRASKRPRARVLWDTKLETGAFVTHDLLGQERQAIRCLVVSGGSFYDTTAGDFVIAFALAVKAGVGRNSCPPL